MPQQPWMLIGLAAVAIPIIIHLLNRRKANNVDWGAMQFLMGSLVSRSRRMLLEEMLLLALRCLLLALLALALSLPFIPPGSRIPWQVILPAVLLGAVALGVGTAMWQYRRWRWWLYGIGLFLLMVASGSWLVQRYLHVQFWQGGSGAQDVAIVIDGSASMTIEIDNRTNFDRAREEAQAVIESLGRGDAVSLILAGPRPQVKTPTPIVNRKDLAKILADLKPTGGPMATVDALDAAAATLAEGDNGRKSIVLVTDGQNVGWETNSEARWGLIKKQLDRLPAPPRIICRQLPLPERFTNVQVAGVELSRKIIGPDRQVGIDVHVQNSGFAPTGAFEVDLFIDNDKKLTRPVAPLDPGASETVSFGYRFERGGLHTVVARATLNDDLPRDNTQARVLKTLERLPVLIIDGNPAPKWTDRASAYIDLALSPVSEEDEPKPDGSTPAVPFEEPTVEEEIPRITPLVESVIVDAPDVGQIKGFEPYSVVVLADVPRLPAEEAERLARFVAEGGGLLIAPGERSVPGFYNAWKTGEGLPVSPARLARRAVRRESQAAHPSVSTFHHDALRVIGDNPNTDLGSAMLTAYWELEVDGDDPNINQCGVLDSGTAFLVERRLGKGRVLMTAASLDSRGSNLPTLDSFVPLVGEMVYYLVRPPRTPLNFEPANQLTLRLSGSAQGNGLRGDYYAKPDFTEHVTSRVDPAINVRWPGSPARGVPADRFSVRWTGSINPPLSAVYQFEIRADDRAELVIDDESLAVSNGGKPMIATAQLTAGRRHAIRIDFTEATAGAYCVLMWSGPETPKEIVPRERLSPMQPLARQLADGVETDLAPPSGPKRKVKLVAKSGQVVAQVDDVVEPGLYRVSLPDFLRDGFGDFIDAEGTVPFSVGGSAEESTLSKLDAAQEGQVVKALEGHVDKLSFAPSSQYMIRVLTGGVPGRHLWKYLAVSALVALLLETALARWIAQQRKTGAERVVDFTSVATDPSAFRSRAEQLVGKTSGTHTESDAA
jgi:hypothetical protein